MGIFAIVLIGLFGWLMWTGRLQRMSVKDGLMLGIAIIGGIMASKGKVIGALPVLASVAYAAFRVRKPSDAKGIGKEQREEDYDVSDARALLGLTETADEEAIRAAHRRLIATVHPDKGGTQALAAKINAARDVLLQHYAITHMHKK